MRDVSPGVRVLRRTRSWQTAGEEQFDSKKGRGNMQEEVTSDRNPVKVVNKLMEIWHAHDIESAAALLAPDFVYTTSVLASLGIKQLDKEGFLRRVWQVTSNSFPDTRVEIINTVAAGDQV